jgi:hypothetical protein
MDLATHSYFKKSKGSKRLLQSIAAPFLTSVLDVGGQLHPPARLSRGETVPHTHWIGSWLDPKACLDVLGKKKNFFPRRNSNPYSSIKQSVA